MFLQEPPETPAVDRLYRDDLDDLGFVMNLTRLWAWRPDVCDAFVAARSVLLGPTTLAPRERAVIVCATVATLGDSYCSLAWGTRLAKSADAATAAALMTGAPAEALSARERALANWSRKVARDPNATTRDDVLELHAAGLSDLEIFEATTLVAFRHAFSMINDALGAQPDWQVAEAAPPQVREAITRGRPVAPRTEATAEAPAR
jgi:uncharacterized peroxidase-related enzyme